MFHGQKLKMITKINHKKSSRKDEEEKNFLKNLRPLCNLGVQPHETS